LPLVLGLPSALAERATPYLTVFSGRPDINVLDAEPAVIAALPGMTSDRLYSVLGQREATGSQNPKLTMELLGPARSSATIEGSRAMRITARVDFDNGWQEHAEAVILLSSDASADEPFRVLAWQDDFDGPT
jgi:general secretion pathway protein K